MRHDISACQNARSLQELGTIKIAHFCESKTDLMHPGDKRKNDSGAE
jgi:hypothetical protein